MQRLPAEVPELCHVGEQFVEFLTKHYSVKFEEGPENEFYRQREELLRANGGRRPAPTSNVIASAIWVPVRPGTS